ncbi:hypothetical protein ALISP_1281 [Alicycliphilus sp. B1]|nr:hypothetical protein ALISP_1281 [Alicycliphilus sp. B1]
MDRRRLLHASFALGSTLLPPMAGATVNESPEWGDAGAAERDSWMGAVMGTKAFDNPGTFSKFSDGMFYLQAPLLWKPSDPSSSLSPVTVPKGFVTDLASIPRPFWFLMPRDGPYADAAIVHDYLYWMQTGTRLVADEIFKMAMKDLEVHPAVIEIIFRGVRSRFGERAWNDNTRRRQAGESRQLLKYPPSSAVRWMDWQLNDGNLARGK